MITLYGAAPMFGLPHCSPYVMKTEVQLMIADVPYVAVPAMPDEGPKGQIPFIDDGGVKIGDSTFIRLHVEERYRVDLDAGLTSEQRAQAWAIERMVENHFAWTTVPGRYFIPENFEKGPGHFFDATPGALRRQLQEEMLEEVHFRTRAILGRHGPDEIVELGVISLRALSTLLGDKPCLFGERPAGVDATVFAMLAALTTPFFDTPLRRRAQAFPNLIAYVDRMMAQFYPDHPWAGAGAPAEEMEPQMQAA
ncbi:glutathione S-transferase family protein [Phenylobacterium sp.]|jgi:glutathione S-transferase|uniref:glutathione S-transferase family protein n=1 Tax=Phenylobacterium sp. TaxID=1871053 RepID=UPI002E31CBE6|nr:glutathione S-transferase family protein [Phenylobacterium sp.]HEX2561807.1 glutathione S-transferase family protein [Phenylobacterium sp.]